MTSKVQYVYLGLMILFLASFTGNANLPALLLAALFFFLYRKKVNNDAAVTIAMRRTFRIFMLVSAMTAISDYSVHHSVEVSHLYPLALYVIAFIAYEVRYQRMNKTNPPIDQ